MAMLRLKLCVYMIVPTASTSTIFADALRANLRIRMTPGIRTQTAPQIRFITKLGEELST